MGGVSSLAMVSIFRGRSRKPRRRAKSAARNRTAFAPRIRKRTPTIGHQVNMAPPVARNSALPAHFSVGRIVYTGCGCRVHVARTSLSFLKWDQVKLSLQCRDDLCAIFYTLVSQVVLADAAADISIERDEARIDCLGDSRAVTMSSRTSLSSNGVMLDTDRAGFFGMVQLAPSEESCRITVPSR